MTNLVIVDEDGNVLSTAEKTDEGFVFSHIPTSGEYFINLRICQKERSLTLWK